MISDLELLDQYARENRQEAFSALLDRYLKLVYSSALRQVRSPELAEEVAQSVFVDLARTAGKLEPKTILTAWLYQVTRRTAIDVVRRESRRQLREQIALDMAHMNSPSSDWTTIEPLLDQAMEELPPLDRTAILLRFFEDKSLREVGQTMGVSEDAAQKRVTRALELLRAGFSKRGRAVGLGSLGTLLTANAVQSAPAGLKTTILASGAIAGAVAPTAGTIAVAKTVAMTTLQKTIIGATLLAAVGTGVYEAQRASVLQTAIQNLQQESTANRAQNDSLRQQLDDASRRIAALQSESEKLQKEGADVIRLRAEVAKLRNTPALPSNDPTSATAQSWVDRVAALRKWFKQSPNATIPEFQYLTDRDWLNAVQKEINSETDYLRAAARLRTAAEKTFIESALKQAISKYQKATDSPFPRTLSQLQPYFDPPVDSAVLERWYIAPRNTVPNLDMGDTMITQIGAVDPVFDTRFAIGAHGQGTTGPEAWDTTSPYHVLAPAFKAYSEAHNGANFDWNEHADLTPFLTTPEQHAAFELIQKRQDI